MSRDDNQKTDLNMTPELRAPVMPLDVDMALILVAGVIVVACGGVLLSARRLDQTDTIRDTHLVGATGIEVSALSRERLLGHWQAADLSLTFRENQLVDISDELSGDLLVGSWRLEDQQVIIDLGERETDRLLLTADNQVLILSDQSGFHFTPGSIFTHD